MPIEVIVIPSLVSLLLSSSFFALRAEASILPEYCSTLAFLNQNEIINHIATIAADAVLNCSFGLLTAKPMSYVVIKIGKQTYYQPVW